MRGGGEESHGSEGLLLQPDTDFYGTLEDVDSYVSDAHILFIAAIRPIAQVDRGDVPWAPTVLLTLVFRDVAKFDEHLGKSLLFLRRSLRVENRGRRSILSESLFHTKLWLGFDPVGMLVL